MQKLNVDKWKRKNQFHYFKDFENPFYNVCTEVDVTRLVTFGEKYNLPFSLTSLYLSLKAVNDYEPFRYRIHGDEVIIYDKVHAGQTVLNTNETFSFCYFPYISNFHDFYDNSLDVLKDHRNNEGQLDPKTDHDDLIHYSTLPWIKFTSISHARQLSRKDSIPKMVFGKYFQDSDKIKMPFSVEVHHALIDGLHIARYLELFQKYLNDPEPYLS